MTAPRNYRDLTIEDLADLLAAAAERAEEAERRATAAEAERDTYQLIATEAVHYGHTLTVRIQRQGDQLERLRQELRELRGHVVMQENRAA